MGVGVGDGVDVGAGVGVGTETGDDASVGAAVGEGAGAVAFLSASRTRWSGSGVAVGVGVGDAAEKPGNVVSGPHAAIMAEAISRSVPTPAAPATRTMTLELCCFLFNQNLGLPIANYC